METPFFILFTESFKVDHKSSNRRRGAKKIGRWRFVLDEINGDHKLSASDFEEDSLASRLSLWPVVRGLESLDQPSRVTLITTSRYVMRGLRFGVNEWRKNDWYWEKFGVQEAVRNEDLWRRVARALEFHKVDCRVWRFDEPENTHGDALAGPHLSFSPNRDEAQNRLSLEPDERLDVGVL